MTKNHGRGLYATKQIKEGELIMAEKAIGFGVEYYSETRK